MTHKELENYILSKPAAELGYPFGETVAVYKVGSSKTAPGSKATPTTGQGKMFALISENSDPLRVSLKCDPILAEKLRDKYESVVAGYHLNKKYWNTIICSGQLTDQEVFELVDLSYRLVVEGMSKQEQALLTK